MRSLSFLVVVGAVLVACGDNITGVPTVDGPMGTPDAPPPPPDAPPQPDAMVVTGRFVLAGAQVPTTTNEANLLGMDIDGTEPGGDPEVDNQLGAILAAVAAQGFDVQSGVDFSIDHGQSITLFDLRADASLHTYAGTDPMPPACASPTDLICRGHLDGTASFDIIAGAPTGSMPMSTTAGTTTGGPGTAVIDLLLLGNTAPLHLDLMGARFSAMILPAGFIDGRIAGAVSTAQIDADVIPAVANAFRAQVVLDCAGAPPPGCGCDPGSNGETLIAVFDVDQDCTITDDEVRNNTLIQALFAADVNIGGVDGVSMGIGIDGAVATFRFTPP